MKSKISEEIRNLIFPNSPVFAPLASALYSLTTQSVLFPNRRRLIHSNGFT